MKLLIFVSSTCSHCPEADRVARIVTPEYSEYGLSYEKIRMTSQQGEELSEKYVVMSIPTLIFVDDEGTEINRIVGAPSEVGLRKKIETLLGLKKSFFGKMFGKKKDE